jgi:hypothetical protein
VIGSKVVMFAKYTLWSNRSRSFSFLPSLLPATEIDDKNWRSETLIFRARGRGVERVVDMSDWHLTGFWGFSITLDPTNAPLVLRDVGTEDIYALTLEEK